MPAPTPSALVPILRQLRRARRRWNARELARAALRLGATSALLGTLLVLAALATAPRRFAVAATLVAAAWLATAAGIALATRRRWLRARTAHRQIDRHTRLAGRLSAFVDLDAAREGAGLRPLLAAENAAILPLWDPRRLVPRRTPTGALAAAIASAIALAAAVALAPTLLPPPAPTVVVPDADARGPRGPGRRERLPRGGVVTEGGGPAAAGAAEDSLLGGLAEALQHRLHRELWGEAEAIRAQELARAESREAPTDPVRREAHGEARDDRGGQSTGRVEPGGESGKDTGAGTEAAEDGGTPEAGDAGAVGDAGLAATADGPARGAGTGTSPDLYGAPTDAGIHRTAAPFTLGLTADVRVVGGGPRPPTGDTPTQMPDASPALAASVRQAVAVPRAPVPPEYAGLVRRLFEREP
jgi:hypothetical protein